jgi:hypothetical protein
MGRGMWRMVCHRYIGICHCQETRNQSIALARFRLVLSGRFSFESSDDRFPICIPITVTVTADITPSASSNSHVFVSHLTGVDLALSRLADFDNVYNATIDKLWETRNMLKTVEFQDFFDFVWGSMMGDKAADIMADDANKFLDLV